MKEIEGIPGEREPMPEFLDEGDFYSANKKGGKYSSSSKRYERSLVMICNEEEIICGDGCSRPAINIIKK